MARLAQSAEDVRRAQQLRFEVFSLELGEGLAESYATGLDVDPFDEVCDHLIVEELATRPSDYPFMHLMPSIRERTMNSQSACDL